MRFIHLLFTLVILSCSPKTNVTSLTADIGLPHDIHQIKYPLPIKPAISAHRGGKYIYGYPENCLETFQHITAKHNMIIECDVAQTKDGVLIFMHDDAVDRTTNGTGKVSDLEWSYLSTLKLEDHLGEATKYRIPTLAQVLKWAPKNAILSLDIKKTVDRAKLIQELKEHKADQFSEIITYNYEAAQYYNTNAQEYRLSVNMRNMEELSLYLSSDIPVHNLKPFVGTRRKEAAFYQQLHDHGLVVTLGTLGNIDEQAKAKGFGTYEKLIEEGVDVFATDYPLVVAAYFYGARQD